MVVLLFASDGAANAGGHGKVGDGGGTVDESVENVQGSVSVGDLLGEEGEADKAGGHDTEDNEEDSVSEVGDLLGAVN